MATITITGIVKNSENQPIQGVTVTLGQDNTQTTDENGAYSISTSAEGVDEISFEKEGYKTLTGTITGEGTVGEANVTLLASGSESNYDELTIELGAAQEGEDQQGDDEPGSGEGGDQPAGGDDTVVTEEVNDFFARNEVFVEDYFPPVFNNALTPEMFPYNSEDLIGLPRVEETATTTEETNTQN